MVLTINKFQCKVTSFDDNNYREYLEQRDKSIYTNNMKNNSNYIPCKSLNIPNGGMQKKKKVNKDTVIYSSYKIGKPIK